MDRAVKPLNSAHNTLFTTCVSSSEISKCVKESMCVYECVSDSGVCNESESDSV